MTELHLRSRGPLTVVLDLDAYLDRCHDYGLTSDVRAAEAFGIERSVATRIRRGESKPGIPFLAGVVGQFGWDAGHELFSIVPDSSPHRLARFRGRTDWRAA